MSAKIEIGAIRDQVKDPMLSDNFLFEIGSVPTGAGDSRPLMIQCQQTTLPGCTINAVEVQLFGHTLEFVGNKTFSHDMSLTFVEDTRGTIRRILERWTELCRSTQGQVGEFKSVYSTTAKISVLDQKGDVALEYTVYGCWPATVPDTSYDGANSSLITHQVSMKYDYYERTGGYTS